MKLIFFDLCSIPVFLLILAAYYRRRIARYPEYRMFFILTALSLICAVLDILMEYVVNPTPLSPTAVVLGTLISFLYKWLRNACAVIYLLFIFAITRTEHRFRPAKIRLLIWAPNALLLFLLIQNFFTGNVFSVTAEGGYSRGPLLMVFYAVTAVYGAAGIAWCLYCRRFIDRGKMMSLLMSYFLTALAICIQFFFPSYMVEMFAASVGLLILMLLVVRPEENLDTSVGVRSWQSFQADLHAMLLSRSSICIGVFQIPNAQEIRNYLGDQRYSAYVRLILDAMRSCLETQDLDSMLYFEHPSNIYLMSDEIDRDLERIMKECLRAAQDSLRKSESGAMQFRPQICLIRCPEDLRQEHEIIRLCHRFSTHGTRNQVWFRAADIADSRDFEIENHIEEVLLRSIQDGTLQMYYQPIYDAHEGRFRSAEALARIVDREYGMISPAIFIPAAERSGLILSLGTAVIEAVFRFISGHDFSESGLSYIEINLSVEQCRQEDLADTVRQLQQKYRISPSQVNFEITESVFDSFEDVVERNMRQLVEMGYTFSLDDYGTGYSNLQRLRKIPLYLIKIDKSLVDDMFTEEGRIILHNTMSMMRGLNKKLVVEGVETRESLDALSEMNCDFIQGFYYSRPLPVDRFIEFMKANNRRTHC